MNLSRRGFTLIETILAVSIMAVITVGVIRWSHKAADDVTVKEEQLYAYRFEAGIKNSMVAILDTFEGVSGTITSDATTSLNWGWMNSSCSGTSLLPVASGKNIVYSINFSALSATDAAALKNKIVSAYGSACSISSSTATSLTLSCGSSFNNLQYDSASGLVNQYHTVGTNFNFLDNPIPVLTLNRRYTQGSLQETKTYRISLSDVIQDRNAYTARKMQEIGKIMKTFYNTKLTIETLNTAPNGLGTADDELIPWHWELFADNSSTATTAACTKNVATGVCDNLNTNNIWRSNASDAILWRRIIVGHFAGNYKYTVDGFGNPLRILPMLSQCAGTNLTACTVSAPSVPTTPYPYSATVRPPYTTLIYSGVSGNGINCADLSTQAPETCRYPIVF